MDELVKISVRDGVKTVNARDLHEYLGSAERLSKWFDRMLEYGFVAGRDYTPYLKVHPQNGQGIADYAMTIDMAKELSMLARTEKGKKARLYFIAVEKRARELQIPNFSDPAEAARAWADQYEQRQIAEDKLIEAAPKAEFYDRVTSSDNCIDMAEAAHVLNIPGIGRNKLFALLRGLGILRKTNEPYQEYVNRDYFRVIEMETPVGVKLKTLVTQKGLDYIRKAID